MKKIFYSLVLAVLFAPFVVNAAGFYFLPQENKIWSGEVFIIELRLDTGASVANAVEVLINFAKEEAEIIDFLIGGSAIDLWVKNPEISNEKGAVSFIGGSTSGFSQDDILGKLILRAKKEGTIKLNFDKSSRSLLANGIGTPLQLENLEGVYIVASRPFDLPQISSISHPDFLKWNASPNLELRWDVKSGADYSYLLSKDPVAEPDEIIESVTGGIEYFGLDDGIYYFHLRERLKGEEWGEIATYRAMIDANPPAPFEIFMDKEKGLFEKKYFIVWNANDKMSGINYYEVCEGKKVCQKAKSPYVLQNQWLGEEIVVRAHDEAGHIREAKITPKIFLSFYIYLFAILILFLFSSIVFILVRRRKKNYAQ